MITIGVLPLKIIGVYRLRREKLSIWNTKNRPFSVLSFRLRGNGNTFVWQERKGEISALVSENDVCYIPQGCSYRQSCENEELICVHFETEEENDVPQFEYGAVELRELFEKLYKVYEKKERGYEALGASLMYKIIYRLQTRRPDLAAEIKALVDENFSDSDFSVSKISVAVHFSETYVRRVFKARYHTSVSKYLLDLKLNTAEAMLKSGYYSVKETARECGYADEKNFSVSFRRKFGTTPSQTKPRD